MKQDVKQGVLLYAGKAKQVFSTDDPELLWVYYLDQATALNGKKKVAIDGKGTLNLHISGLLFKELAATGFPTHFVTDMDNQNMLVRRAKMIPLEVVVRNRASGHFVSRFNVTPLRVLDPAIHEFYYKSDALDDPFMNDEQIVALGIAPRATLDTLRTMADQVNTWLTARWARAGIELVDFKLEFGRLADGTLVLADELSPDNMRLIDAQTHASLDKDVFRQDEGPLVPVYAEVLRRLQATQQEVHHV
ncbi:phosphoribosylaminoimidazolesuccinocarboxamide synthase [Lacticaseibacillus thailandensis]|uniref:Phosphoribosylaminoimidazole-succinocarboxamide synthase n=1 Tax=Lacticaseibacillus thailandensis DSM 22698 = JCM 13996 TaxID=1423810 RepID=A0A0R2CAH2_9LACO|nr:phosphoribosylaminoimidazolesuccinocarboxamide synthase [Lacticaseibacillus thailandensis]KRM88368.1 phosphoribosylaminoimidazole-succinocarboxamide synthase [Lacticaseibacillus thailandensis DSM 22698 = JCM 13996]